MHGTSFSQETTRVEFEVRGKQIVAGARKLGSGGSSRPGLTLLLRMGAKAAWLQTPHQPSPTKIRCMGGPSG